MPEKDAPLYAEGASEGFFSAGVDDLTGPPFDVQLRDLQRRLTTERLKTYDPVS